MHKGARLHKGYPAGGGCVCVCMCACVSAVCVCEPYAVQGRELLLQCGLGQALCWDIMLQTWPSPSCLSTRSWTSCLGGCLLLLAWMQAKQVNTPRKHSCSYPISHPISHHICHPISDAAGRCTLYQVVHACMSVRVFNRAEVYAAVARSKCAVVVMCPRPHLCLQKLGNINPALVVGQYEAILPYCFLNH